MADEEATTTPPPEQEDTKEAVGLDQEAAGEETGKEKSPEPQAEGQQEATEDDLKKEEEELTPKVEEEAPKEEPKEEAAPKEEEAAPKEEEVAPKEEEAVPKDDEPPTLEVTSKEPEPSASDEAPKDDEPPTLEVTSKEPEPSASDEAPKDDEPPKDAQASEPSKENGRDESATTAENGQEAAAPKHPPRERVRSTDPAVPVDFAFNDTPLGSIDPITLGVLFKQAKERFPDAPALAFEVEGKEGWQKFTYTEYYDQCIRAAKSLLKLELEPLHGVAIMGFNSPEWFITNMAAIFAGGLSCGIYATNTPDVCQYIANDCQANIAVVEDEKQLDKFLQIRKDLPHLKAIVQYKGKLSEQHPDVYDWDQFLELGNSIDSSVVEKKMNEQKPGDCAALIYTSGTTGSPKGVMLSHDNITWTLNGLDMEFEFVPGAERGVSYLPLSHIAAQIADMYLSLKIGAQCFFARPDALKGTLRDTLLKAEPTIFFAVPRVWEKFMAAIKAKAPTGGVKKMISSWAKGKGLQGGSNMQKGVSKPWGWGVANKMVFSKVKAGLGLQHCKMFSTSAAPIRREVLDYFLSLGIPLIELWGMSEGTGPIVSNLLRPGMWKIGSVGKPYPGVEIKLFDKKEDGEGEVCFRARNAMMGYLHQEEKTAEAIDDEGWVHSGDLGKIDEEGFLFITGRIKELIITSGGENVAPVPIEDRIKKEVPFLSNVMVVGDHRNYLTCLVTMKCVIDVETGDPTDELTTEAIELVAAQGSSVTKVSQIVDNQDRAVFSAIQDGIDQANKGAISNAQTVKKWTLVDTDFTVNGGELGPTYKLRRFYAAQKYADTIEALYT